MGYYTNFDVETDGKVPLEDVIKFIDENAGLLFSDDYDISSMFENGDSDDQWMWYDHEEVMKIISKKFPELLITLHGEGEENSDMWKEYYLGGKVQVAKAEITYPKFNEKLLV